MRVPALASTSSLVSRKLQIRKTESLQLQIALRYGDLRDYDLEVVGSSQLTATVSIDDYTKLTVVGSDACEFYVLLTNIQTGLAAVTNTYSLEIIV
jgi:hypothetical protein